MRSTVDFSRDWLFRRGDSSGAEAEGFADGSWQPLHLPHSWNATDTFVASRGYYRGPGWYRKAFELPSTVRDGRVFLDFKGAYAVAAVWVNGVPCGTYTDGFTGFRVDASAAARPGTNVVAVRVDNSHDPDILPGIETPDYNLYGGLYREAELVLTGPLHVGHHGLRVVTPEVDKGAARIVVDAEVRNCGPVARPFRAELLIEEDEGRVVAEATAEAAAEPDGASRIRLDPPLLMHPRLWSPETPELYRARLRLFEGDARRDELSVGFGIRTFEFHADDGFRLNGRSLKLRGVNRHQDYPGLGNALPERLQVRDAEILRTLGANFVRTSHYPQHPAFLDACDRLGILVYEEIASWQYVGGEAFADNAERMLRAMIARDANHPSIVLWGLLNEGRDRALFERLHRAAREADATRPTVYAENRPEEALALGTAGIPDVLGINYRLDGLDQLRREMPGIAILSSEHTNYDRAVPGDYEEEMRQMERIAADLRILEERPFVAGGALWSMHDYGTDYEPVWPVQHSGILDACRVPKEAYHYLRSRWSEEPVLHICGHWSWTGETGRSRPVFVVTNCESVELFINGRSQGIRQGERLVRYDVVYEPGTLLAVGHYNGRPYAARLDTAGPAAGVRLTARPRTVKADGRDMTEITVEISDARGTRLPHEDGEVVFSVAGPGRLRGVGGANRATVHAGIGRIILQALEDPGTITVIADYGDLSPSSLVLQAVHPDEGA
jgi:beta-galactosidase